MAKKNKIKKEQFIEVLQQIPEEDLRSFIKKILSEPVVKTQFEKHLNPILSTRIQSKFTLIKSLKPFMMPKMNTTTFLSTNNPYYLIKCMMFWKRLTRSERKAFLKQPLISALNAGKQS